MTNGNGGTISAAEALASLEAAGEVVRLVLWLDDSIIADLEGWQMRGRPGELPLRP